MGREVGARDVCPKNAISCQWSVVSGQLGRVAIS